MALFRSIILIIALVAQALPVSLVAQGDVKPVCSMKCCEPGAKICCCAGPQDVPSSPAPASTPPVTGRDLVPQPVWIAWTNEFSCLPVEAAASVSRTMSGDHRALAVPHVRLPVLFCSILI